MDWQQIAAPLIKLGLTGLGTAFGGPLGGTVGSALGSAIAGALGTDPTPAAVATALATTDPETVKARLADLEGARQADLASLQAQLADVQDARHQTVALAQAGSPLSWGPAAVSVLVMLTFGAVIGVVIMRGVPAGAEAVAIGLVETLKALTIAVVSYWVGSSAGSKRNGDAMRAIAVQTSGVAVVDAAGRMIGTAIKRAATP